MESEYVDSDPGGLYPDGPASANRLRVFLRECESDMLTAEEREGIQRNLISAFEHGKIRKGQLVHERDARRVAIQMVKWQHPL